ncbi:WhiB family transcriptional regulator [Amycolatopsis rubida]|uniref:WhiB family transcriptional regulator n=1 Tax=Amycolatopsis rubida TaxID=112413 RepID=A0ABX0C2K2_9PSEU|nr:MULTISPECIES: WhiB family transcriptional regulator [Amycolatopsis]MYW94169.1 WhiB family transcriptional regulator [Amycolatopsis rubida]NEC59158.1 WhiB family transcriptional regulator [Amycolatopsis rubida]OAP20912.1 Transcriptional regulator WhiB1 [Amycolatopsis sp. M39]
MDELALIGIAWRLDALRWVPSDVLHDIVTRDGLCMWPPDGDPPPASSDAELAARMCGGCPVRDMCLELELRTAGAATVGIWGGMTDDDRRALHPHWLRRGERAGGAR